MAQNINRVVITGNLTRDPDVRALSNGSSVCELRVAVNNRRKGTNGEWEDKPNYLDVVVWGTQGENAGRYLQKGRSVAIDGRLDWTEWEKDGQKRQSVKIVAESVQFLSAPDATATTSTGANFAPPPSAPSTDDIPF
jgi:single-strand DNA-binding protein